MDLIVTDKHSSLLRHETIYAGKKHYDADPQTKPRSNFQLKWLHACHALTVQFSLTETPLITS